MLFQGDRKREREQVRYERERRIGKEQVKNTQVSWKEMGL